MNTGLDIAAVWAQGDTIARTVAVALLLMSVASWCIILGKTWLVWRLRLKTPRTLEQFWDSATVEAGLEKLAPVAPLRDMAHQGQSAIRHLESHRHEQGHLDAHLSASELVTRALRNSIARSTAKLESGLTLLASVGSTAPFVGLFGTVWGIYHALARIGATGQSSLDQVAGPVGEALIMTAAGLFVAIPAVLAYNAFTRSLRLIAADLEAFAHDLHAYFSTGYPLPTPQGSVSRLSPASAGAETHAGTENPRLAAVAGGN
jgi:biopolymer transport protein ExbB